MVVVVLHPMLRVVRAPVAAMSLLLVLCFQHLYVRVYVCGHAAQRQESLYYKSKYPHIKYCLYSNYFCMLRNTRVSGVQLVEFYNWIQSHDVCAYFLSLSPPPPPLHTMVFRSQVGGDGKVGEYIGGWSGLPQFPDRKHLECHVIPFALYPHFAYMFI